MSITYRIDQQRRVVMGRARGVLSEPEVRAHYQRLAADPTLDAGFCHLTDIRDVTRIVATPETVRNVALLGAFLARQRRAIVAATDEQYGVARMFAGYAGLAGGTVEAFRSWTDAVEWLAFEGGLEPTD